MKTLLILFLMGGNPLNRFAYVLVPDISKNGDGQAGIYSAAMKYFDKKGIKTISDISRLPVGTDTCQVARASFSYNGTGWKVSVVVDIRDCNGNLVYMEEGHATNRGSKYESAEIAAKAALSGIKGKYRLGQP